MQIEGFTFSSNFDSGNLGKVELVSKRTVDKDGSKKKSKKNVKGLSELVDYEFNIWTSPDCANTPYENGNKTWFYFAIAGGSPLCRLRLNLMNLNKQSRLYSFGMAPVYKIVPGKTKWDRIPDKPTYKMEAGKFSVSFKIEMPENPEAMVYLAFTYPYTYAELQAALLKWDLKLGKGEGVYYHREVLCHSLEGNQVDLITISSESGMKDVREERLQGLFPNKEMPRAFQFEGKKVIFVTSRVHPGETPSSFVFNGFFSFILRRNDPRAAKLREKFVFKLVPFLNPDGVIFGHYRTDTRGVNLNRVYENPCPIHHPSIYAIRQLVLHHHQKNRPSNVRYNFENILDVTNNNSASSSSDNKLVDLEGKLEDLNLSSHVQDHIFLLPSRKFKPSEHRVCTCANNPGAKIVKESDVSDTESCDKLRTTWNEDVNEPVKVCYEESTLDSDLWKAQHNQEIDDESGIYLYVDLHGHASKRGCFLYGNHFTDSRLRQEVMLYAKLLSLNCVNFDFGACNFSERNMYQRDRHNDTSKAGSGRVALYKATSLARCYTLECNYNTGRWFSTIPELPDPNVKDVTREPPVGVPPKYTPSSYAEVGEAMAVALLDMVEENPVSRLPQTEYKDLNGVRRWITRYINALPVSSQSVASNSCRPSAAAQKCFESPTTSRVSPKTKSVYKKLPLCRSPSMIKKSRSSTSKCLKDSNKDDSPRSPVAGTSKQSFYKDSLKSKRKLSFEKIRRDDNKKHDFTSGRVKLKVFNRGAAEVKLSSPPDLQCSGIKRSRKKESGSKKAKRDGVKLKCKSISFSNLESSFRKAESDGKRPSKLLLDIPEDGNQKSSPGPPANTPISSHEILPVCSGIARHIPSETLLVEENLRSFKSLSDVTADTERFKEKAHPSGLESAAESKTSARKILRNKKKLKRINSLQKDSVLASVRMKKVKKLKKQASL